VPFIRQQPHTKVPIPRGKEDKGDYQLRIQELRIEEPEVSRLSSSVVPLHAGRRTGASGFRLRQSYAATRRPAKEGRGHRAGRRLCAAPLYWLWIENLTTRDEGGIIRNESPNKLLFLEQLSMETTIEAVFENGILRPLTPLKLKDHQKVRLIVEQHGSPVQESSGIFTGLDSETIDEIALSPSYLPEEA
jgi:predicted DNA-binding antitoxin AbrB/MazE fold protein